MFKDVLLIGIGGFAGSVARFLVSRAIVVTVAGVFPWGTFVVNVLGSLLIGVMMSLFSAGAWWYLGVVGFCGGFTTFSTFSADLFTMFRQGHYLLGAIYIASSVIVCLAAVGVGFYICQKFNLKIL